MARSGRRAGSRTHVPPERHATRATFLLTVRYVCPQLSVPGNDGPEQAGPHMGRGLLRRRSMQPHFERIWLPLAQGTARRRRTRRRANSIRFRTASPATLPLRASSRCSSAGEQAGLAGLNVVVSATSAELKARRWDPPSSRKSSTHDGLSCNVRMRNEHLVLQE